MTMKHILSVAGVVVFLLPHLADAFVVGHTYQGTSRFPNLPPGEHTRTNVVCMIDSELEKLALEAIHDIDNVKENKLVETRKVGMRVTVEMRKRHTDHQEKLQNLDIMMDSLKQLKLYVQFAYDFMSKYVVTGNLKVTYGEKKEDESSERHRLFLQAKSIFNEDFDKEAFQECVANHGFCFIDFEWRRGKYYEGSYRDMVTITMSLLDDSEETETAAEDQD